MVRVKQKDVSNNKDKIRVTRIYCGSSEDPLPGATLDSQDNNDDLGVLILHKNLCFMEVQVFFFITE